MIYSNHIPIINKRPRGHIAQSYDYSINIHSEIRRQKKNPIYLIFDN